MSAAPDDEPPAHPDPARAGERMALVEAAVRGRGIDDERVLAAMAALPRELFLPVSRASHAYDDRAIGIGHGQTISQPYVVARTCALLRLRGAERVLEIGAGSGYQAAMLGLLAARVVSVERIPELAERAYRSLRAAGVENVDVVVADGSLGHPLGAPYDAIAVAAAAPVVPAPLLEQLADGGRLVMPVGPPTFQRLVRIERRGPDYLREAFDDVVFVPLISHS